ncbi:leucine-rich repeat domain-containing protein [Massilia sp. W12]|uniref:leucine-rich repeat domain-containing protein n=1 Tax=Massilia sp. W12 TaxID=3126507 RepID=UPI0030CE5A17
MTVWGKTGSMAWCADWGDGMEWDDPERARRQALDAQACRAEVGGLIAQEAMRQSGALDLSFFSALQALPAELGDLRHLRALDVSVCGISDLTPLAALTALQELDCAHTQVSDLAPLAALTALQLLNCAATQVSDLAPLAALTALQSLDCSETEASDLAPLAALTALQSLDFSATQVSDLTPLAALTALQELNCSYTKVSDLAPLAALTALQELNCGGTQVSDLAPLAALTALQELNCSYTEVCDLAPLVALKSLQKLYCSSTQISDLAPLATLTALQELNCWNTEVSDLSSLAALTALQVLSCYETQVSNLAPLAALTALQSLTCYRTQVSDLAPLAALTALHALDCSYTAITSLPPCLPKLRKLDISGCHLQTADAAFLHSPALEELIAEDSQLPDMPAEILSHRHDDNCLPRLRAYLHDLQSGAKPLCSAKLMILGNGRVGKTQLLNRLRDIDFDENADSTHGVQIQRLQADDSAWHAWDFGGQDIYHSTHALFLRNRAAFLIVWSPDCESGEHIDQYGMRHNNQTLEYWLRYVLCNAGAECPVMIVQTRCETAQQQRAQLPAPAHLLAQFKQLEILHYSSKNKRKHSALEEALQEAHVYLMAQHPAHIPNGWQRVADVLCAWREQDNNCASADKQHRLVTQAQFAELCAQGHGDVSAASALLDYLHHAGLVFYQAGVFDNSIILDQAWALDAIYTVFQRDTCYQWLKNAKGRFTRNDLALRAWQQFSASEQKLFLGMMCSCGIAFCIRNTGHQSEAEYLAPDFLPERAEISTQLASEWDADLPFAESILDYDLLQPGLMRTLIAKIGSQAGQHALYWRHGVCVYELASRSKALIVQESTGAFSGRLILRTQRGDAKGLLQKLLMMLDHDRWQWRDQAQFKQCPQEKTMSEHAEKPQFGPEPPDESRITYAVSYKWEEQSTNMVDKLCEQAQQQGMRIMRDKDDVKLGDSLSTFMNRLTHQDRVFVILSDAYLRSPNCMYELWQIWRLAQHDPAQFMQAVRVYVMADAKIFSFKERAPYAIYWKTEFEQMDALLREHGPSIMGAKDYEQYRLMQFFSLHVSEILSYCADTLLPRNFEELCRYGFAESAKRQKGM